MTTVESVLAEAQQLAGRLRSRELSVNSLAEWTEVLQRRAQCQRQYQEEVTRQTLSDAGVARSSRRRWPPAVECNRLKELEVENSRLRATLDEQRAYLELLMIRYRHRSRQQLQSASAVDCSPSGCTEPAAAREVRLRERLQQMATVMREAARRDDTRAQQLTEELTMLQTENCSLRQLLGIASCGHNGEVSATPSESGSCSPASQPSGDSE